MNLTRICRLALAAVFTFALLSCGESPSSLATGPTDAPNAPPSPPATSGEQTGDADEGDEAPPADDGQSEDGEGDPAAEGDTDDDGESAPTDGDDPASDAGASSTVTVLLTDAPGDVVAAWIDIREIYLQGGDADGRLVLFEGETGYIELLALADSATAVVDSVEVPAGSYGQLRLVLGGAAIQLESGEVYVTAGAAPPDTLTAEDVAGELKCPSCDTSGFKVLLKGRDLTMEEAQELLLLDFDVSESFHAAGQSGRWIMKPVIELFEDMAQTD